MVNLPSVPRRLATTQTPQNRVTAADVAGPYRLISDALSAFGEGVNTLERAARNKQQSDLGTRVEEDVGQAARDHAGNPEGFRKWATDYSRTLVAQERHPIIKRSVETLVNRATVRTYNGLADQLATATLNNSRTSMLSRLDVLDNRMAAIAREGGAGTEEFASLQSDVGGIYDELRAQPLYGYPQDRVAAEVGKMEARHKAEATVGLAQRMYDRSGRQAAREFLEKELWAPDLNLDERERRAYIGAGLSALDGRTAEQEAAVKAHRATVDQTVTFLRSGARMDPRRVSELTERAGELGDAESVYKLHAADWANRTLAGFRSAPDNRKAAALTEMAGGGSFVARVVQAESGGDPNARASTSSATGTGQFINSTWLRMMRAHEPALTQGKSDVEILAMRTDPDLSASMVNRLAAENANLLRTAGAPVNDGTLYLAHFLGPDDAVRVLQADPSTPVSSVVQLASVAANRSVFGKHKTAGALVAWANGKMGGPANPFMDAERVRLANELRGDLSKELDGKVGSIIDAWGKRQRVSSDELGQVVEWVQITGNFSAGQKLADYLETASGSALVANMPLASRRGVTRLLTTRAQTEGASAADRKLLDMLGEDVKAREDGMKRAPIMEAVLRGLAVEPQQIAPEDPDQLTAALPDRQARVNQLREYDPSLGPVQALDDDEIARLAPVLTRGPAQNAARLIGALGQLDNETFGATLAQKPMADALKTMVASGDATRMGAAFAAMDRIYRTDPQNFSAQFGKEAFKQLAVWQEHAAFMTPDQIAERFRRADDPQTRAAREKVMVAAEKEGNALTDSQIVGAFPSEWFSLNRDRSPDDPVQLQVLRDETAMLYAELRADGVAPDQALSRASSWVSRVWGPSTASSGRLMRRPPESWAPMVNGSHDWLRGELDSEVSRIVGKPRFMPAPGGPGMPVRERGQASFDYALVPDATTERELARFNAWKAANNGRTPPQELWPSYGLAIFDYERRELDIADAGRGSRRFRFSSTSLDESLGRLTDASAIRAAEMSEMERAGLSFGVP